METPDILHHTIEAALSDMGAVSARHEHIVERVAVQSYTIGRREALRGLLTLRQAAIELGMDPSNLSRRATRLGLGTMAGTTVRLFTREDMERLRG